MLSNNRSLSPSLCSRSLLDFSDITLIEVRRSAVSQRHALLYFKIPFCTYTEQIKYTKKTVPNFIGVSYNSFDESITVCVQVSERIGKSLRSLECINRLADAHASQYLELLNRIYKG